MKRIAIVQFPEALAGVIASPEGAKQSQKRIAEPVARSEGSKQSYTGSEFASSLRSSQPLSLLAMTQLLPRAELLQKILLVLTAFFLSAGVLHIALGAEVKKEVLTKHISGEVSAISSNFLALVYNVDMKAQTSYEMTFTIDKNVKLEGKGALSEIAAGDTISIVYDETSETDDKGNQRIMECLVKRLIFVKAGLNQFQEAEPQKTSPEVSPAAPVEAGAGEKKEDLWNLIKK